MSGLGERVIEYLAVRRAVGFKLVQTERLLASFVSFADAEGATTVTVDLALRWATLPTTASAAWWTSRLCAVRCFARHLSSIDPATEVPPLDALGRVPAASTRATPYLYTKAEIAALLKAADMKRFSFTTTTCRTVIGLLSVTGMRVGEALRLDDRDIDWDQRLLVVRHSKFDRSRHVPLHPSTIDALASYVAERNARFPRPSSPALFVAWRGGRLSYGGIRWHFDQLVRAAGLAPRSTRCRPRLHDFRHLFASTTLEEWYRTGVDVPAKLPILSTYLGHVDPASTYWYLSDTPELLGLAVGRLEGQLGDLP